MAIYLQAFCPTPMMSAPPNDQPLSIHRRRQVRPLVTIVTVVYNAADVLVETIDSVVNQTYPDIEYIVIDGASTDGTAKIIQQYAGAITTVVREPDRGIYDAMNKGLRLARGEIIGLLNAGDRYRPEAVATVVEAYQNSVPVDDTDCVLIAASLEAIAHSGFHYLKQPNLWQMDRDLSLPHPSLFVTKAVFDKFGLFATNYQIAADYDFVLRTYRHCQILLLSEVTTIMAPLGKSSNYWLTANEAHAARLANGFPLPISYGFLVLKRLRIAAHLGLDQVGLWKFIEPLGKQKTRSL
jgi:glycosyltransferase involved in cell wall biosynthesis